MMNNLILQTDNWISSLFWMSNMTVSNNFIIISIYVKVIEWLLKLPIGKQVIHKLKSHLRLAHMPTMELMTDFLVTPCTYGI